MRICSILKPKQVFKSRAWKVKQPTVPYTTYLKNCVKKLIVARMLVHQKVDDSVGVTVAGRSMRLWLVGLCVGFTYGWLDPDGAWTDQLETGTWALSCTKIAQLKGSLAKHIKPPLPAASSCAVVCMPPLPDVSRCVVLCMPPLPDASCAVVFLSLALCSRPSTLCHSPDLCRWLSVAAVDSWCTPVSSVV